MEKEAVPPQQQQSTEAVQQCVLDYLLADRTKGVPRNAVTRVPKRLLAAAARYRRGESRAEIAVILCQGAYNPIHEGHFNMAISAKHFLESNYGTQQVEVAACYLSPAPDGHIDTKMGKDSAQKRVALRLEERCALIDKCIEKHDENADLDGLFVLDRWEALQARAPNPVAVWASLHAFLRADARLKDVPVTVYFMVGSDKLNYADGTKTMDARRHAVEFGGQKYALPLIIKDRPDQNNQNAEAKMAVYRQYTPEKMRREALYVLGPDGNFSSTQVRDMVAGRE